MAVNSDDNNGASEAKRHSLEGWRSFVGGIVAISIGCYDVWVLGPQKGLSVEIDELLIFVGVGLMVSIPNILTQYLAGAVQKVTSAEEKTVKQEIRKEAGEASHAQISGTKTQEGIPKQP